MTSRLAPAALALLFAALPARAEEAPDPLRFGNDETFLALSPFLQLDGGWASAAPRDLLTDDERREGTVRRARLYADFGFGDVGGRWSSTSRRPAGSRCPTPFSTTSRPMR